MFFSPLILKYIFFASRINNKLPNYFSEGPDPFAIEFDAFINPWPPSVYAFPPIHLVQQFITHFLDQDIEFALLICPLWPSQPYFSSILNMLIDVPLIISASEVENAVCLPKTLSSLMGCFISSSSTLQEVFRQKQPLVSSEVSNLIHCAPTSEAGSPLHLGVLGGRLIKARYL